MIKSNDNSNEKNETICVDPASLRKLMEQAAQVGAKAGIDRYIDEMKNSQKQRGDRRLRNTKLLLRNYRMLKLNAENSIFGRTQMQESAADILMSMMNLYSDEVVVESIKNSATRTAIIVSHVENMIEMYNILCDRSANEIDRRRYDVVHSLYIAEDKISRKDIALKWHITVDTTYSDEKIAIERLSAMIFGVDGLY